MAKKETKICKHCKEEIARDAKKCPKCGGTFGMAIWEKILIVCIVIVVCVVGCMKGCSDAVDEAVEDTKNAYKDINGKTSFKVNESFQNKYEKITMTEVFTNFTDYDEYSKPSSGNKYVGFKVEVENISEDNDEMYISYASFNGYADGVSAKSAYVLNDKYDDLSATIGKGKKALGYVFFEVPKDAKKITAEYNADFWVDGNTIEFIIQE